VVLISVLTPLPASAFRRNNDGIGLDASKVCIQQAELYEHCVSSVRESDQRSASSIIDGSGGPERKCLLLFMQPMRTHLLPDSNSRLRLLLIVKLAPVCDLALSLHWSGGRLDMPKRVTMDLHSREMMPKKAVFQTTYFFRPQRQDVILPPVGYVEGSSCDSQHPQITVSIWIERAPPRVHCNNHVSCLKLTSKCCLLSANHSELAPHPCSHDSICSRPPQVRSDRDEN
jgi:hypothetical protein